MQAQNYEYRPVSCPAPELQEAPARAVSPPSTSPKTTADGQTDECSGDPIHSPTPSKGEASTVSSQLEPTKVIRGRGHNWLASAAIHLPPLAATCALAYINLAHLFWFPLSGVDIGFSRVPANNMLKFLQVVAKVYGLMVVASLATIIIKTYKRCLVQNGIPFGFLTAPYRITDILYICKPIFWRGAGRSLSLALLLVLSALLSALAGPASAILIVPSLGWFQMSNPFANIYMPVIVYLPNQEWATTFNSSLFSDNSTCLGRGGKFVSHCPAGGYTHIFNWAYSWGATGLPDSITLPNPPGTVTRELKMKSGAESGTFLTTLAADTLATIGKVKDYFDRNNVGRVSSVERYQLQLTASSNAYQPLLNAKCKVWNLEDLDESEASKLAFPTAHLNCFTTGSENECSRMKDKYSELYIPKKILSGKGIGYYLNTAEGHLGLESNHTDAPSFLVFSARLPYSKNLTTTGTAIAACSYMAHWVPSLFSVDSNVTGVETNITDLSVFSDEKSWRESKKAAVGSPIWFQRSWLPYLDDQFANVTNQTVYKVDNETVNNFPVVGSIFGSLGLLFQDDYSTDDLLFGPGSSFDETKVSGQKAIMQATVEKATGSLLTDAVARYIGYYEEPTAAIMGPYGSGNHSAFYDILVLQRVPGGSRVMLYENGTALTIDGRTEKIASSIQDAIEGFTALAGLSLYFESKEYGYGYGQAEAPMIFALTVIITYAIVLVCYGISNTYKSTHNIIAWDDQQDLLTLAWTSPAPAELNGQGANVTNSNLWRETVAVRATSSKQVNLVLDNYQPGTFRLCRGETYW